MLDYNADWSPSGDRAMLEAVQCTREDDTWRRDCSRSDETIIQWSVLDWQTGEQMILDEALIISECLYEFTIYGCEVVSWSPDENHIVFRRLNDEDNFYHLDLTTQITHSLPDDFQLESYWIGEFWDWTWSKDSSHIIYAVKDDADDESTLYRYNLATQQTAEWLTMPIDARWMEIHLSPSGRYIMQPNNEYAIYDTQTETVIDWIPHSRVIQAGPLMVVKWHEDEEWFFSGSNTSSAGGGFNSQAIALHHVDESVRRELTLCYNLDSCTGFLPDRVIPHLAPGKATSWIPPQQE
jgi:protease II